MPMLSIETVKKAERLIQERGRIVAATWDHVAENPGFALPHGGLLNLTPADEQLQSAIKEFRKRKLDVIDADLRDLGVAPSEQDSGA